MMEIETTLCLFMKENEILLALKKRGFGEGKYNGVGGKLKGDETPEEAMIREAKEEIDCVPKDFEKMGEVEFLEFINGEKSKLKFHLYVATKWDGTPKETEEMKPYWFKVNEIPYDKMFKDDTYWLPLILENKKIKAKFEFDEEWNLVSKNIEELD